VAAQTVADDAFHALATQRAAHALRLAAALNQTDALHAAKRAQVRRRGLALLSWSIRATSRAVVRAAWDCIGGFCVPVTLRAFARSLIVCFNPIRVGRF